MDRLQAGRNSNLSYAYDNPQYVPSLVPPPYNRTWYYVYPEGSFRCDSVVLVSPAGADV